MTIIICTSDYWFNREYFQITNDSDVVQISDDSKPCKISGEPLRKPVRRTRLMHLDLDGISAFYLLREIKEFTYLRLHLSKHLSWNECECSQIVIQIVPPAKDVIDYKWNRMLAHTLWVKIETDYLMSWLSTLGGGFSALGEQFSNCAATAGKISLRQLSIGLRLGDPFLQARCKLYYSISLIQIGRLREAKHLVREQYKFARTQKEIDGRLVKMCKGIFLRVQYEYGLRIAAKSKQQLAGAGDN